MNVSILDTVNYKLPFMVNQTTGYNFISDSNILFITQDPIIFFGNFRNSEYTFLKLKVTETLNSDYLTMLKQITPENKKKFLSENMKWLKKCCVDSQLLGNNKDTLCGSYTSDFYGLPNYLCDAQAESYCSSNRTDPACACYSMDPKIIGDGYDVLTWEYLKKYNPTDISPKCVINACKSSDAYKSRYMLREDCPHLCTSILNVKNSGKSITDINNVIIGVKCGSGEQHYGIGKGPIHPVDKKKWIYIIIGLIISIIIIGVIIFYIIKNKSHNNK
jgi:hypothetical protein